MTNTPESDDSKITFADLPTGRTHYELTGPENGRTVVLLHGGTIPMWVWDRQVPPLAHAGFRVLRYDMYGRGHSDSPDRPYDRRLYCTQLLELLDALDLASPIDLVGISFGGAASANFAVHHPNRVGRIALIAPVVNYKAGRLMFGCLGKPLLGELMMWLGGLRIIEKRAFEFFQSLDGADRYKKLFTKQIHSEKFTGDFLSMIRTDALGDYHDVYRRLGEQGRNMMLVWGTADEEIPYESIRYLRDSLPGVHYHSLEGVSHGSVAEVPEEINNLLVGFLAER